MSHDVPETVEVTADNQGILIKFHDTGTGLCSDVIYHQETSWRGGSNRGILRWPTWCYRSLRILWSRPQDDENILAMCVRQLIFDTYED